MTPKTRLDALGDTIERLHRDRHIPPTIAHIQQLPTEDLHRLLAEIQALKPQALKVLK